MTSFYTVGSDNPTQSLGSAMNIEQPLTGAPSIQVQHNTAPMTYDGNSNQVTARGNQSTNTSEGTNVTSNSGTAKQFISKADDRVMYQGLEVQASVLERMGILSFDKQSDRYVEVTQTLQSQQQEQTQEQAEDIHSSYSMSESDNAEINSCIPEGLNGAVLTSITNRAIEASVSGDFASTIKSFSASTGQTPEQATASVTKAMGVFQRGADGYLGKVIGMSAEDTADFYAWTKANNAGELKAAVNSMINANSFVKLGKLTDAWSQANPPSVSSLNNAGYKTGVGSDGKGTVFLNGREVGIAAAARARLI